MRRFDSLRALLASQDTSPVVARSAPALEVRFECLQNRGGDVRASTPNQFVL